MRIKKKKKGLNEGCFLNVIIISYSSIILIINEKLIYIGLSYKNWTSIG